MQLVTDAQPEDPPAERDGRERISIRPGVSILSVLRHLNYRPWFALAELVDNSLQSFLDHRTALERLEGEGFQLRVSIEVDPLDEGRIVVRDNAAGIHAEDYHRAFRPAAIPPESDGLNEFGMGMKSAACWFAPQWYVRTSALGEPVERTVRFDVRRIVEDSLEELDVSTRPADPADHFTEIVLLRPYKLPQGRTVSKIKDHLTDIYRVYTRAGTLELAYGGEPLRYEPPKVLVTPYFKEPDGPPVVWRKEIDFDFGDGLRARGFAAIREKGSTKRAGFALFRRDRLIQGSGDEGYRPLAVFGASTTAVYQRLFGELHLDGFEVSHTKDGFQWDDNEEPFLDLLREHLDAGDLPLIKQARGHRVRESTPSLKKGAEEAAESTAGSLERDGAEAYDGLRHDLDEDPVPEGLPEAELAARRVVEVCFRGERWRIVIELTNDPAVGDWLELSEAVVAAAQPGPDEPPARQLGVRMSLANPFMVRYGGTRASQIEPMLRLAAGIALAEQAARDAKVPYASRVRRNLNELLREALSNP